MTEWNDNPTPASDPAAEVVATPAAQAHADEVGVDLTQVQGTGADGKITKADVAAAAEAEPQRTVVRTTQNADGSVTSTEYQVESDPAGDFITLDGERVPVVPAERLSASQA